MKARTLCYKLNMPILPCRISVIVGATMLRDFMDYTGMHQHTFLSGMLHDPSKLGGFLQLDDGMFAIILPEHWDHGVVYHEALHAATAMWYDVGAELKVPDNDEVLTYTMNYIVNYIEEVCYADKEQV